MWQEKINFFEEKNAGKFSKLKKIVLAAHMCAFVCIYYIMRSMYIYACENFLSLEPGTWVVLPPYGMWINYKYQKKYIQKYIKKDGKL